MLDMHYIISVYLNQKYAYVKNIRLCANMMVKGLFTSDTEYEPGMSPTEARKLGLMSDGHLPAPREMAFHVPKGCCWDDLYDMIKFPARSKSSKRGVIHGIGVSFDGKEKGTDSTVLAWHFYRTYKNIMQSPCKIFYTTLLSVTSYNLA